MRCVYIPAMAWDSTTAIVEINAGTLDTWRLDASTDNVRTVVLVPETWSGSDDLVLIPDYLPDFSNAVDDGETFVWDLAWEKIGGTIHTAAAATATDTQVGTGASNGYRTIALTIDHDESNNALEACRVVDGVTECDRVALALTFDETNSTYNGGTGNAHFIGASLCWP